MKLSRNDLILTAVIVLLGLACFFIFNRVSKITGSTAVISIDGKEYKRVSLDRDDSFTIETDYGINTVVIKNGEIFVESADCPDGICVRHSHINKLHENIVCLPHRLVIEIIEGNRGDIDAVAE